MCLQSQLNNSAFRELPQTHDSISTAKNIQQKSSMEQIALREILNCFPSLTDMNDQQKRTLDNKIIENFNYRSYIN